MELENLYDISQKQILVFGDYMLDEYINGKVSRISPEAPVQVLKVFDRNYRLGGAGNVVNNLIALECKVRVLGIIGKDIPGGWIYNKFKVFGVDLSFLKRKTSYKTICKTRLTAQNQQLLRYDEEECQEIGEDYEKEIQKKIDCILDGIDVIIISDYQKGAVNEKIANFLINKANQKGIPSVVDPKGKNYNKYKKATVCTPNMKELNEIAASEIKTDEELEKEGTKICQKFNFRYLLVTRSEKGLSLFDKDKKGKEDFKVVEKEVVDVSGAGDTVVATVAIMLANKFSMQEICVIANVAASIVISKFGTATVTKNELISEILKNKHFKLVTKETAKYIFSALRETNKEKKIVFTNGCFDLLHAGHISSFKQAKQFGDFLVVAVNTDDSIKSIKGEGRPIIKQEYRVEMLMALEIVDYVILMEDLEPSKIIELIKPDVTIKGIDWKGKNIPEEKILKKIGSHMEFIQLEEGLSTTNIIKKIKETYKEDQK